MAAVLSLLPNAGLGNKLFVWARGWVFAERHGLPHESVPWSQLTLRQYLTPGRGRGLYGLDLRTSLRDLGRVALGGLGARVIREPEDLVKEPNRALYVFDRVPHWTDYFADLKSARVEVRAKLRTMARARVAEAFSLPAPVLSVHVRCGDFKPPDPNVPFAKQGAKRTPLEYFIELLASLRRDPRWADAPISVFSDGTREELAELLAVPGTRLVSMRSDLAEIFYMSRSQVIVPGAGSTFSAWAGFLSDGHYVHHPDHFYCSARPPGPYWEGPWDGQGPAGAG